MSSIIVTILAAGEGKRMRSEIPKVLHLFCGKPMLVWIIETARTLCPEKIIIVTGRHHKQIIKTLAKWMDSFGIVFVEQPEPIGTGNAVMCCLDHYITESKVLILNGDMPLITASLLDSFIRYYANTDCVVLTAILSNPHGYGRILYENGSFAGIIEEKDCTEEQRKIHEINSGIYLISGNVLQTFLPKITNDNAQGEYYLTDIVKWIRTSSSHFCSTYLIDESENFCIRGINTPEELLELSNF